MLARDVAHVLRVLGQSRFSPPLVPLSVGLDRRLACTPCCASRPVLLGVPVDVPSLARSAPVSCMLWSWHWSDPKSVDLASAPNRRLANAGLPPHRPPPSPSAPRARPQRPRAVPGRRCSGPPTAPEPQAERQQLQSGGRCSRAARIWTRECALPAPSKKADVGGPQDRAGGTPGYAAIAPMHAAAAVRDASPLADIAKSATSPGKVVWLDALRTSAITAACHHWMPFRECVSAARARPYRASACGMSTQTPAAACGPERLDAAARDEDPRADAAHGRRIQEQGPRRPAAAHQLQPLLRPRPGRRGREGADHRRGGDEGAGLAADAGVALPPGCGAHEEELAEVDLR